MNRCRICGSTEDHPVIAAREMMFGLGHQFEYFQCLRCSCLQIVSIPADMAPYYPDNYYSMQAPVDRAQGPLSRARDALEGRFRRHVSNRLFGESRRQRIFDWLSGTHAVYGSAILDVGSGRGRLLHELHRFGFTDLTGADPYVDRELSHPNGIVIHKCELAELSRIFDVIMMHHTLEHLADPLATMTAAHDHLRAGGYLLLRIPLVDCYAYREYGADWFALDAPRHFYLHTERSVEILAKQAGFVVERVVYDSGAHQLWGSEQYRRGIPHRSATSHEENPKASIFTSAQIRAFARKSRALNAERQGDSACFYLHRADG